MGNMKKGCFFVISTYLVILSRVHSFGLLFFKNVKSFSKPSLIIRSILKPGFVGEGISDIELESI